MGVETPSSEYQAFVGQWQRCRHAVEGSDAIKAEGLRYLPMIGDPNDPACTEKYLAYKKRALWHGYTARVVEGLEGAIFRKRPEIQIPEAKRDLVNSIAPDGESLYDFSQIVCREVIITGYHGILVDRDDAESIEGKAYMAGYRAESIMSVKYDIKNGQHRLARVVLKEKIAAEDPSDPFVTVYKDQFRVLMLDEEGLYTVQIWVEADGVRDRGRSEYVHDETQDKRPTLLGNRISYLPFFLVGPNPKKRGIQKPPILDVADANISHYRTSADLENGRHWVGCPTLWGAGIPEDSKPVIIGSPVAHFFPNPEASLHLLELTEGLVPLENAMKEKEDLIVVLGGRLLEAQKAGVEAAETHRQRKAGENSVMATIANSISSTLTKAMKCWAEWSKIDPKEVSLSLNTDFIAELMDPALLREFKDMLRNGEMSEKVFRYNMKKAEVYPDGWTEEDEADAIQESGVL